MQEIINNNDCHCTGCEYQRALDNAEKFVENMTEPYTGDDPFILDAIKTKLEDMKNECELNALENQSPEC